MPYKEDNNPLDDEDENTENLMGNDNDGGTWKTVNPSFDNWQKKQDEEFQRNLKKKGYNMNKRKGGSSKKRKSNKKTRKLRKSKKSRKLRKSKRNIRKRKSRK